MRRYIIISFSILLVVILSLPWVIGYQYKQRYLAITDNINKQHTNQVQINVTSYQHGWLHSTAKTDIIIKSTQQQPIATIKTESTISHGPIIYDYDKKRFSFGLAAAKDKLVIETTIKNPIVVPLFSATSESSFYFNDTFSYIVNIPKTQFQNEQGTIRWDGATSTITAKLKADMITNVVMNMQLGALSIQGASNTQGNMPVSLSLSPITITSDTSYTSPTLPPVEKSTIQLPNASLRFDQTSASIDTLVSTVTTSLTANRYSALLESKINKIALPQFSIPELSAINFNIAINNVNAAELAKEKPTLSIIKVNDIPENLTIFNPDTTVIGMFSLNSPFGTLHFDIAANWRAVATHPATKVEDLSKLVHATGNLTIGIPLTQKIAALIAPLAPDYIAKLRQSAVLNDPALMETTEPKSQFDKQIATYVQKNQMSLPDAIAIMNAHDKAHDEHLSQDTFKQQVNALHTTNEIKLALIHAHESNNEMGEATQAANKPLTVDEMVSLMITDWLQHGYILPKENNYIVNILIDTGVTQLNGHPVI